MAGAYPSFCGMKQLGVLLLPLDGMLVHLRATPSSMPPASILYTWVKRDSIMHLHVVSFIVAGTGPRTTNLQI